MSRLAAENQSVNLGQGARRHAAATPSARTLPAAPRLALLAD
jgi:hypothetical protein